jgi:hypothetical protein
MGRPRHFLSAARYDLVERGNIRAELVNNRGNPVSPFKAHAAPRTPTILAATALLISTCVVGCRHQDLARQRLATRDAGVRNTARIFVQNERDQPAQLAGTLKMIKGNLELDAQRSKENVPEYGGYLIHDLDHWRSRQADYPRWLYDAVKGNPANLEPVAIMLFY